MENEIEIEKGGIYIEEERRERELERIILEDKLSETWHIDMGLGVGLLVLFVCMYVCKCVCMYVY